MPYTADPNDVSKPTDLDIHGGQTPAEFHALKQARLDDLEAQATKNDEFETGIQTATDKNDEQDTRLDSIESVNSTQNTNINNLQSENTAQGNTLTDHENELGSLDSRVTNIENDGSLDAYKESVSDWIKEWAPDFDTIIWDDAADNGGTRATDVSLDGSNQLGLNDAPGWITLYITQYYTVNASDQVTSAVSFRLEPRMFYVGGAPGETSPGYAELLGTRLNLGSQVLATSNGASTAVVKGFYQDGSPDFLQFLTEDNGSDFAYHIRRITWRKDPSAAADSNGLLVDN